MSQETIHQTTDLDVINLWADEELFGEGMDQEEETSLIPVLRSTKFESLQKTIFYRLCGLIITYLEGSINENDFQTVLREFLYDFTTNSDLIDKLAAQIRFIIKEIKTIATNGNYFGNEGIRIIPKSSENIRKKTLFVNTIEAANFTNILQCSDFGLINRIELGFFAVMLEVGFNCFNQKIRSEIEKIRQSANEDMLPVYRKGIDLVINDTIYLTNRTYGILYNKFYNNILKQFVDKI